MVDTIVTQLNKRFPTYGERNVFWFYIVSALGHSWFQIGNWLLFALLFVSAQEFAVYEAVAFGIAVLLEIPSGAFADLLGKRRATIMGYSIIALGSVLFTIGHISNVNILLGNILIIGGFAFISGSLEALVYDTLVESDKTSHYDEIRGKAHSLALAAGVIAGIIGGVAWLIGLHLPWILTSIVFTVATLCSMKLREPNVDTEKYSFRNFVAQNQRGFHYLFNSSFSKYTFSLTALAGIYLMWSAGIIRVLMGESFGYDGDTLNYLIAFTMVVSFLATFYFKEIRAFLKDKVGFTAILLIACVGWLIAALFTQSMLFGAATFILITTTGNLGQVWTSVILNSHVRSNDRATALSTLSFLVQIPYVLIVVLYAELLQNGNIDTFYYSVAAILLVSAIIYFIVDRPKNNT